MRSRLEKVSYEHKKGEVRSFLHNQSEEPKQALNFTVS